MKSVAIFGATLLYVVMQNLVGFFLHDHLHIAVMKKK